MNYKFQELNLFKDNQLLTTYKRQIRKKYAQSNTKDSFSIKNNLSFSNIDEREVLTKHSQDRKSLSPIKNQLSIDHLKAKISEYLSINKNGIDTNLYHAETSPDLFEKKGKDNFRITMFKNNIKRKIHQKLIKEALTPELSTEITKNEFNISEVPIRRKDNAKAPRDRSSFSMKRQDLRYHGQNKFFDQAIHFRTTRLTKPTKSIPNIASRKNSQLKQEKHKLEFKDFEPWKKQYRENQSIEFCDF